MQTLQPRVLVAEDDELVRRTIERIFQRHSYELVLVADGVEALAELRNSLFDVVLSDIHMPRLNGVELLRAIREYDADVPVVLMTGDPTVESAVEAIRLGALQYVLKPLKPDELATAVERAVKLRRIAHLKNRAIDLFSGSPGGDSDLLALNAAFDRALSNLWMAYQPIVWARDGSLYGYECLLRSTELRLPHPGAVVDAAERLDRVEELGRAIRKAVTIPLDRAPAGTAIFVNLHSRDLVDPLLYGDSNPLGRYANRVILEITERASLDATPDARDRIARLREAGFRIAIDDLGAGYSGLTSFATLEPELVKLDMTLVRDIDSIPVKRKLVTSVTKLCRELGMLVVGEGVETKAERDTLAECGCDLLQGYLFARPDRPFPAHAWP